MLAPARVLTIETAMEWIDADELVEVTPEAVRVRKQILADQPAAAAERGHRGRAERLADLRDGLGGGRVPGELIRSGVVAPSDASCPRDRVRGRARRGRRASLGVRGRARAAGAGARGGARGRLGGAPVHGGAPARSRQRGRVARPRRAPHPHRRGRPKPSGCSTPRCCGCPRCARPSRGGRGRAGRWAGTPTPRATWRRMPRRTATSRRSASWPDGTKPTVARRASSPRGASLLSLAQDEATQREARRMVRALVILVDLRRSCLFPGAARTRRDAGSASVARPRRATPCRCPSSSVPSTNAACSARCVSPSCPTRWSPPPGAARRRSREARRRRPRAPREPRQRPRARGEPVAHDAHDAAARRQRQAAPLLLEPRTAPVPVGHVEQRDGARRFSRASRGDVESGTSSCPARSAKARRSRTGRLACTTRSRPTMARTCLGSGLSTATVSRAAADGIGRLARVDRDLGAARPLDGLRVEHLRPGLGHLLQAREIDLRQVHGLGHDARIGRVDAVDVAVDLAALGPERRREGHRGGVAAAATERRDLAAVAHALVTRDDDDATARQLVLDAVGAHLEDARVEVAVVGDDAALRAGEADRVGAARVDGDGQQRHGDPLARRDEHVELAPRRLGRHALGQLEQPVGGLAHRADDDHDVVARLLRGHDPVGHGADLLHVGDRRATVLLDQDRHVATRDWNARPSGYHAARAAAKYRR